MTPEALILAINLACKFSNPNITREKKEICMEKIVNCAIIENGKIPYENYKKCEKLYRIR